MSELIAKVRFQIKDTNNYILHSTSEEIISYLTNEHILYINVGTDLTIGGTNYRVDEIKTELYEKSEKIYGISYAEPVGKIVPHSIMITYLITEA
jgi:hypothetical protein